MVFKKHEKSALAHYRNLKVNSGVEAVVDTGLKMQLDEYGQYVPVRVGPSDPELEETLRRVNILDPLSEDQTVIATRLFGGDPEVRYDELIGFYRSLYIGHVSDENDRLHSTSGGISTWILSSLLKRRLVDGVIHMAKGPRGSGTLFEYRISRTVTEVREAAKTRYYPGEVSSVLNTIRNGDLGSRFVLVGIPEVIAEVRLLSRELPEFSELVPLTLGLLCAHQKTTKFVESMAWQLGLDPSSLTDADFRLKRAGARADRYLTQITGLSQGTSLTKTLEPEDSLVANWGLGFFKADFSDFTDDVFNETADVALGDAWLKEYSSDYRGNNVVIVRSPIIEEVLRDGMSTGAISLREVDVDTVRRCQAGLVRHTHDELGFRLFRLMRSGVIPPRTRTLPSGHIRFLRKLEQVQRMGNADGSRRRYRQAEEAGKLSIFTRFAKRRIFLHRVVRVFELWLREPRPNLSSSSHR